MCVLMSTSGVVRKDMRDWVLSHEGDKWSSQGACTGS